MVYNISTFHHFWSSMSFPNIAKNGWTFALLTSLQFEFFSHNMWCNCLSWRHSGWKLFLTDRDVVYHLTHVSRWVTPWPVSQTSFSLSVPASLAFPSDVISVMSHLQPVAIGGEHVSPLPGHRGGDQHTAHASLQAPVLLIEQPAKQRQFKKRIQEMLVKEETGREKCVSC